MISVCGFLRISLKCQCSNLQCFSFTMFSTKTTIHLSANTNNQNVKPHITNIQNNRNVMYSTIPAARTSWIQNQSSYKPTVTINTTRIQNVTANKCIKPGIRYVRTTSDIANHNVETPKVWILKFFLL